GDAAELLPPLPNYGKQFGPVAAHLFRRPSRVEHLLEPFQHAGVNRAFNRRTFCSREVYAMNTAIKRFGTAARADRGKFRADRAAFLPPFPAPRLSIDP